MSWKAEDFDYVLPAELVAQRPAEPRDSSGLMVLDRSAGRRDHRRFTDLPELLQAGDLLVVNDTQVIPARFECRRPSGGRIEGLFLREGDPGQWIVMLKGASRCRLGEELAITGADDARMTLSERQGEGVWRVEVGGGESPAALLERVGRTPLPPYIRRPGEMDDSDDRQSYQTIYAARPGAVAAPTAGLHFTERVTAALAAKGVETAKVTLHVGLGTFAPVKVDKLADHTMHSEWWQMSADAARAVRAAKDDGRRVIAVGTTSVRVVEAASAGGAFEAGDGWTDLFLYPPADFRVVDALLTNFHLPRSTLLMLVAAFCSPGAEDGLGMILDAYAEAVRERYRFYSYGDAMLIL